ncbi:MAG: hypothetical protein G8237_04945 [Magnetococcales bacterium]|nr:hypothetical protein [Magnetococcales bacterium]NGZ05683.1 hypothetical protein [Magnetococcales bacterium]
MAAEIFPRINPGPFDRITGWSWPTITYRLHLIRDDGLHYTPETPENLEILLYDSRWNLLFTGSTSAVPELHHMAATPGLILRFTYVAPHYVISFDRTVLRTLLELTGNHFELFLVTQGERTLECTYPRRYTGNGPEPRHIRPGSHTIPIPFWERTTQTLQTHLRTLRIQTTIRSSVPFTTHYTISNGMALARFRLPILAVTWTPNARLTGWNHTLHLTILCPGIEYLLPRQIIANLNPPPDPPSSPTDQVKTLHGGLIVTLGLGACSGLWSSMQVALHTNFNYEATLPFAATESSGYNTTFPIGGVHGPNLASSQSYIRTHTLVWSPDHFLYQTGHWPLVYHSQIATLEPSPVARYDAIDLQPQPE